MATNDDAWWTVDEIKAYRKFALTDAEYESYHSPNPFSKLTSKIEETKWAKSAEAEAIANARSKPVADLAWATVRDARKKLGLVGPCWSSLRKDAEAAASRASYLKNWATEIAVVEVAAAAEIVAAAEVAAAEAEACAEARYKLEYGAGADEAEAIERTARLDWCKTQTAHCAETSAAEAKAWAALEKARAASENFKEHPEVLKAIAASTAARVEAWDTGSRTAGGFPKYEKAYVAEIKAKFKYSRIDEETALWVAKSKAYVAFEVAKAANSVATSWRIKAENKKLYRD